MMSYFGHTNIFLNPNPDYNIYFVKNLFQIVEILNVTKHVTNTIIINLNENGRLPQKHLIYDSFDWKIGRSWAEVGTVLGQVKWSLRSK